jgi:hypothetical protein
MNWVGGMGVVVLSVAILPLLGVGGSQALRAETPGPMKDDKLTPRIAQTAKGLWGVYGLITSACMLAYWLGGMSVEDAVLHGFSTMGLGGFSSHDASFGHFNSPLLEAIAVFFMLLAGINFSTHFLVLTRRTIKSYRMDREAHAFWLLMIGSVLLVAYYLWRENTYSDFILRFDFQLTPGANNGIGIRAPLSGDAAYVGMEIQVLDNEHPKYAQLQPYQYHGSVYGVIPAKRGYLLPTGQWNTEEISLRGNEIKVTLNGTVITEGNLAEVSKNGTMDHKEHPGLLRKEGHIGFLGHGDVVRFKNIRIKKW